MSFNCPAFAERSGEYLSTLPLWSVSTHAVSLAESPVEYAGPPSLVGLWVGVLAGNRYGPQCCRSWKIEVEEASLQLMPRMLRQGRIQACCTNPWLSPPCADGGG